jgi:hypothetical protein
MGDGCAVTGREHSGSETLVPGQLARADEVDASVDPLMHAPADPAEDLFIGGAFLLQFRICQQAAAATRNRCEDATIESIHGEQVHPGL